MAFPMTSEHAGEWAKLRQAFSERLQDIKSKQKELNIFAISFIVEPSDVPDSSQHNVIDLKVQITNLPLLELSYLCGEDFSFPRRHALKFTPVFETPHCCEQFFSKLTLAKTQLHSRLTDRLWCGGPPVLLGPWTWPIW